MQYIIGIIAIASFISLILQVVQVFKAIKPVDNTDEIACVVIFIEKQIALSKEYIHIVSCELLLHTMLIDKYEPAFIADHIRDLDNKIQWQRIVVQLGTSSVSVEAMIREMDAEELDYMLQTLPLSKVEMINLCMSQYKKLTGEEYKF